MCDCELLLAGASVAPVGAQGGRTDLGRGRLFPLGVVDCAWAIAPAKHLLLW